MPATITEDKETVEKLDLLDRQPFVEQLISIANMLADNKKNACYAINGSWGVGKTYVLDMFEQQIRDYGQEGTTLGRFLVLHYNCWQYDYYEEPLIAIVSAMMDAIDDEVCLLSSETKEIIKNALREIAKDFLNEANRFVKKKTGINIKKWVTFWKTAKENAEKKIEENHSFDTYFDFKKKLAKLKDTIGSLSKDQTVLFVVDELDRCLPEYAIKVLERLHHVFDEIPNVQVVLSVDKQQLENTVSQIYGTGTSVESYLAKFIDFEVKLDAGTIQDNFEMRFKYYTKNFELINKDINQSEIDHFIKTIMEGIDMRKRIAIVEKCQLLHTFVSNNSVMDSSLMCMEILMVILFESKIDLEIANNYFDELDPFSKGFGNVQSAFKTVPLGLGKISEMYASNNTPSGGGRYFKRDPEDGVVYINASTLLGRIIGGYRYLIGYKDDYWNEKNKAWFVISEEKPFWEDHITKFWDFLQKIN